MQQTSDAQLNFYKTDVKIYIESLAAGGLVATLLTLSYQMGIDVTHAMMVYLHFVHVPVVLDAGIHVVVARSSRAEDVARQAQRVVALPETVHPQHARVYASAEEQVALFLEVGHSRSPTQEVGLKCKQDRGEKDSEVLQAVSLLLPQRR